MTNEKKEEKKSSPTDYERTIRERAAERTTLRQVIKEGITEPQPKPSLRQKVELEKGREEDTK